MLAASVLVIHVLAAPTQLGTEGDLVPFFTSPQAALASGHAPRELLLRSRLRQEVQVRHHTPEGSVVTADQLLFDLSFSSRARSTTAVDIFTSPYLSAHSFPFGAKREVHLLEFKHPWAFVSTPEGRRGWVLTKWLEALPSDPGRWLTRRDTFARAKDSPSARIITTIRSQEWLTALSYHRGWIKVRYRDYEVFVDLKDVVGRADFATWGYNASQKKWLQLSGRDGGIIFGLKGEKHWVDDFSGWIGDPHKALVSGEIRRLQTEFRHWNLSKLPEHGLVWWSTAGVTSSPLKTSVFSLDEV
ncbi:MAG: hypothetical protein N2578_07640, partial [Bdellovibrionaceae bacterium]|nr:hypothetical protein [Pseudobdellovibrionaceae bacterium]